MMTIAGFPFLTDFQTKKLLNDLQTKAGLLVSKIDSQQVYVFEKNLSTDEQKKAIDLLNQGQI